MTLIIGCIVGFLCWRLCKLSEFRLFLIVAVIVVLLYV